MISEEKYKEEINKREELLRHFFTSKYHRFRIILFYLLRFIYITLFQDFKKRFTDTVKIDKVVRNKNKNKNSIRVLYDFQTFSAQKVGGISRIFMELINNLSKDENFSPELAIRYADNYYLKEAKFVDNKKVINIKPPVRHYTEIIPPPPFQENSLLVNLTRKILLNLLNMKYLNQPGIYFGSLKPPDYYTYYEANVKRAIKFLKKGNFDIFHPTYYDTYFLKYLKGKPFVLTIYDMIHEKFPQCHHNNDIISKQKKILAEKASKIIAISEQTKKDIIEILNIPEEKIIVIPLASSFKIKTKKVKIKNLPRKYLLFVGQRITYKNFNYMIRSISSLLRKDKNLYLVCVGDKRASGPFTEQEKNLFKNLKISKKLLYLKADDNNLQYLYSKALAFVFPTLYEGFGIPILEAFSCGCPVVCSDIDVLREVGKDAAIYFNPRDKKSIHDAVNKIITDKSLRKSLIEKGFERNKLFSWKKTAEKIKELYEKI